jgi:hypothetical protein
LQHDTSRRQQSNRAADEHVAVDRDERAMPGGHLVDSDSEKCVRDQLLGWRITGGGMHAGPAEDQIVAVKAFVMIEDGLTRDQDLHGDEYRRRDRNPESLLRGCPLSV